MITKQFLGSALAVSTFAFVPASAFAQETSEFDCVHSQVEDTIGATMVQDMMFMQGLAEQPAPYRDELDATIEECAAQTTSTPEQSRAYRDVAYAHLVQPVFEAELTSYDFDVEPLRALVSDAAVDPEVNLPPILMAEYGSTFESMMEEDSERATRIIFLVVGYGYSEWKRLTATEILAQR